jgi:hypothetical protein
MGRYHSSLQWPEYQPGPTAVTSAITDVAVAAVAPIFVAAGAALR